ncbi:hypothetical protein FKR81_12650 [Lentzea tibetensis]|uniref:Peptidase M41 domain-containing protein n=1 Tax=Lentzea tibetensis TaxID=2591470 RepID=A0A563EW58_9PSEU|nr:hypothetical protein [Lentzea tibetensis]TWP51711.1 hypothetical protein FKR81_12650 [Lentzea tibetensis]
MNPTTVVVDHDLATIAHHEAAHAVGALVSGNAVPKVRIWQATLAGWRGWTDMEFEESPDGDHAAAVALLAGVAAELAWLEEHDVLRSAWPHDVDASGAYDRTVVHECLARIPRAQRPSFRAVQGEADRLVAAHWGRITDLAARLIDARCLHHVTR